MAQLPVVQITGTIGLASQDQFRQACIDHGTTHQTVQELPFRLDTSQATNMSSMFFGCSSLTSVSDLDTSQATNLASMFYGCTSLTTVPNLDTSQATNLTAMFYGCTSLTDGNVRLIGRHPEANTLLMIAGSGLTREPFYDAIPVTAQAPTFLDEEPWVILPVQDHITYSVSGTPGWNSSVTVTATADEGYVISGQSSWTKAWGAKPLPSNALIQEDIDMVYFGNQWAEALYRGGMVVWEFVTPRITTFSLTEMVEGQYFSQQINTNFEVVSWSAEGLPAGLSLSQSGLLSGTPTAESFGVVTITANGIGPRTAQVSYQWSVDIPALTRESIRASGANKTSHNGWARPNVTWTANSGTPQYGSNGTLHMRHGRGQVRASVTLNSARQGRIVSNLNGVLATSSSSTGWQINSGNRAFQAGEQIYIELNGYSGNANDRFYLYAEP